MDEANICEWREKIFVSQAKNIREWSEIFVSEVKYCDILKRNISGWSKKFVGEAKNIREWSEIFMSEAKFASLHWLCIVCNSRENIRNTIIIIFFLNCEIWTYRRCNISIYYFLHKYRSTTITPLCFPFVYNHHFWFWYFIIECHPMANADQIQVGGLYKTNIDFFPNPTIKIFTNPILKHHDWGFMKIWQ